jgi:nicotinamidase-related amidase
VAFTVERLSVVGRGHAAHERIDAAVLKRGVSALAGTELDRLFRISDGNILVLAGVATQFVVEGTARDAVDRGYPVIVLEDCCASRRRDLHDFSTDVILRELCHVTDSERFIAMLETGHTA